MRRGATTTSLGNQNSVKALRLLGTGEPSGRLRSVTRVMRAAKQTPPGSSNLLLGPAFRLMASTGLYQRFIDHQRFIHTFVTNLMGPEISLDLGGHRVTEIISPTVASGSITVSFAVLSYTGSLTVTRVTDPVTCPDLGHMQAFLRNELAVLTGGVQS